MFSRVRAPASDGVFAKAVAVLLLGSLCLVEIWNHSSLPIYWIVTANADGLVIEDVARDLISGGSLFDWRLTQAPYLFPDLLVSVLLVSLGVGTGLVGLVYAPIFMGACLLLLWWLCREARLPAFLPLTVGGFLFLVGNLLPPLTDGVSIGFSLIGHHSGVIPLTVIALALVLRFMHGHGSDLLNLVGLVAVLAVGAASDASLIWTVLPACALATAITYIGRSKGGRRWGEFWAAVLVGLVLSRGYSVMTPFPQDTDFLGKALSGWPESVPKSIDDFRMDVGTGLLTQPTFMLVAFALVISIFLALSTLIGERSVGNEQSLPVVLLASVVLLAPVLGVGTQIILGSYSPGLGLQRWAPMIFLSIVLASALVSVRIPRATNAVTWVVSSLTLGALTFMLVQSPQVSGQPSTLNPFKQAADCMRSQGIRPGSAFLADYWAARAIAMYSESTYVPVAVGDEFQQFPNGSKVRRTQRAKPTLGVAYYRSTVEDFTKRFGQPARILCRNDGAGIAVLDYSGRSPSLTALAEVAEGAA